MQLREFYNHFLDQLKPLYVYEEAAAISTMIFEHFAGKDRAAVITNPQYEIAPKELSALENALLELKRKVPVQYVIGHAWFLSMKFNVNPSVLIPRPETEELVTAALQYLQPGENISLLDIGTGSGCIPISIKKKLPLLAISALEISEDALSLAKQNASQNEVSIHWIEKDFLNEAEWKDLPVYDAITSNPPYIPLKEKAILDTNVTAHEPHLALFVPDNNPLIFYEKIAGFAENHLTTGGCIFMETHEAYATEVARLFNAKGYAAVVKKDLFEKERMVIASRFH